MTFDESKKSDYHNGDIEIEELIKEREEKDNLNPGNKQVIKEIVADLTRVPGPSDTT